MTSRFLRVSALILLLVAMVGVQANAQSAKPAVAPPTTPPAQQIMAVDDPRNKLHLTADQQVKLHNQVLQLQPMFNSIVTDKKLTDAQKQQQVKALYAQLNKEQNSVLTPAQLADVKARGDEAAKYRSAIQAMQKTMQAQSVQIQKTVTPDQRKRRMRYRPK